jgi:hypothetical protein
MAKYLLRAALFVILSTSSHHGEAAAHLTAFARSRL